jgi:hypothetical protein
MAPASASRRQSPAASAYNALVRRPMGFATGASQNAISLARKESCMNANIMFAGLAAAVSLGLAGCDVQKTQEGDVDLPKYEVAKKQDGDVTVPKYDVTAPDVNVTKKETEVTVPKITTEKETITVPSVDVKTGKEKAAEQGK